MVLSCGECDVISFCFICNGSVCLVCCVLDSVCACDPSVQLSVSSIGFVYVLYVGSYLLI